MDWRDYLPGIKGEPPNKHDKPQPPPAPPVIGKPKGALPNIEKVPPMPPCKPPKSPTLRQLGNCIIRPEDVSAIYQKDASSLNIALKNGVVFVIPDHPELKKQVFEIFNLEIKEPNDDQKAN